jgi:hypothetical protein
LIQASSHTASVPLLANPALEDVVCSFEPDKTCEDQQFDCLKTLREDCNKRVDAARKMATDLFEAKERERKERRQVEKAAKAERRLKEEARAERKRREAAAIADVQLQDDKERERKRRERSMRLKEQLRIKKLDSRSILVVPGATSATKPTDLFDRFSEASVTSEGVPSPSQKRVSWDDANVSDQRIHSSQPTKKGADGVSDKPEEVTLALASDADDDEGEKSHLESAGESLHRERDKPDKSLKHSRSSEVKKHDKTTPSHDKNKDTSLSTAASEDDESRREKTSKTTKNRPDSEHARKERTTSSSLKLSGETKSSIQDGEALKSSHSQSSAGRRPHSLSKHHHSSKFEKSKTLVSKKSKADDQDAKGHRSISRPKDRLASDQVKVRSHSLEPRKSTADKVAPSHEPRPGRADKPRHSHKSKSGGLESKSHRSSSLPKDRHTSNEVKVRSSSLEPSKANADKEAMKDGLASQHSESRVGRSKETHGSKKQRSSSSDALHESSRGLSIKKQRSEVSSNVDRKKTTTDKNRPSSLGSTHKHRHGHGDGQRKDKSLKDGTIDHAKSTTILYANKSSHKIDSEPAKNDKKLQKPSYMHKLNSSILKPSAYSKSSAAGTDKNTHNKASTTVQSAIGAPAAMTKKRSKDEHDAKTSQKSSGMPSSHKHHRRTPHSTADKKKKKTKYSFAEFDSNMGFGPSRSRSMV